MDDILDLEFVSSESYVYYWNDEGKQINFHLHLGKYYSDRRYIVIRDRMFLLNKDIKLLNYIDTAIFEFNMKICCIFGF